MEGKWAALYAKRTAKKKKSFQDGFLLVKANKLVLLDEGENPLDEKFRGQRDVVMQGGDLEFDRYIVQVDSRVGGTDATGGSSSTKKDLAAEKEDFSQTKTKALYFPLKKKLKPSIERRTTNQILDRLRTPNGFSQQRSSQNAQASQVFVCDENGKNASLCLRLNIVPDVTPPVQFYFQAAGQLQRNVAIPDKFKDCSEYKEVMSSALIEEISLMISDFARRFNSAKDKIQAAIKPSCSHGECELRRNDEDGDFKGRWFYTCSRNPPCMKSWADTAIVKSAQLSADELERLYASYDINLYAHCHLVRRSSRPGYINIHLGRTVPLNYAKGDLMVISSSSNFPEKNSEEFTVVATSESFGSSRNAAVELRLHGQPVPIREGKKIYVLQGPSLQSELTMLDCIRKIQSSSTPLLPLLMGSDTYVPRQAVVPTSMDRVAKEAIFKYNLNSDQAKVLFTVGGWFASEDITMPRVCLVLGPFGSGKSHLLVALVIFLSEILNKQNDFSTRFIIASATNSAVDRVLTGLLEHGFDDFLRVGSLGKIASNILPYSVHAASKNCKEEDDAEKDLKELLKDAVGKERASIENELKAIKDGKLHHRKTRLQKVRAVGVTCCSTINEVLHGNTFKICFLDECSQIVEPLSLLPISQFRCERLVAVGDPQQLPPVLSPTETNSFAKSADLSRTLFERLAALGHRPVPLQTQYRCHPRLSRVPNRLFYEGRLVDGCSEMERSALLLSIPPLVFCDTCKEGKEKKDFLTGSYSNPYEAETVCSFVKLLISKMISGSQIGVIALYKSQESLIRQMLYPKDACVGFGRKKETAHSEVENVKVSTVDAFQGLEKDVIILSCCRTAGLGFLASKQRLNVALTRARHHLFIIGSASNLQRNSLWEELLEPLRRNPNTFRSSEDMKKALLGCSEAGCSSDGSKDSIDSTAGLAVLNPPPSISFELDSLFDEDDVSLKKLLEVLDDVNFRPRDFWQGYKLYCIGHYSHSQSHQDEFAQTLMADVIRNVHGMGEFQWGGKFDKFVRSTWSTMEEYIKRRHGVNCGDISFLIREYDDSQALAASEHGSFFFKMCEDETPFPRETNPDERQKPREDETNSVIDSLMGQLSSMDERLAKLVK